MSGATWRLGVAVLMMGCTHSTEPDYVRGRSANIDETAFHPMAIRGEQVLQYAAIGSASVVGVSPGVLWLGDSKGDPFIHMIDLRTARPIRSIGRHGNGPGDFQSVFALSNRLRDTTAIWAYDIRIRRMSRVSVDSHTKVSVIPVSISAAQVAWLGRERMVAAGVSGSSGLALLDSAGAVVRAAPTLLLGDSAVPNKLRVQLSRQVKVCSRPDGLAFALVFMDAGRADIYDALLHRTAQVTVPFPSNGVFNRDNRTGAVTAQAPRMYYVGCVATAQFIFAVFSGRHGDLQHGVVQADSRFIHVFDWTGHFLGVLALDHDVMAAAVDGSDMYTVSFESDTVFRYSIPAVPRR